MSFFDYFQQNSKIKKLNPRFQKPFWQKYAPELALQSYRKIRVRRFNFWVFLIKIRKNSGKKNMQIFRFLIVALSGLI